MDELVEIGRHQLQKLVDNFYSVCSMCDELDIYEHEELDESMQNKIAYVDEKFGRKLKNLK